VVLRFFRINDPYRLLGLLILLTIISLPFFIDPPATTLEELKNLVLGEAIAEGKLMYVQVIDFTAPMATGFFGLIDFVFGRSTSARKILALLLIFFQASYFAILLINNKAYNDSTYVPALIFGILCFFSFDMFSFSPELLGSTVLLLALNNLFKEIEFRSQRYEIMLYLGVCLGAATLLIFSYFIFLPGTIIILFIFTRPTVRKILLLLFGFCLPHALLITLYYFWGKTSMLWQGYYIPNLTFHSENLIGLKSILVLVALPTGYFVFSLFMLNREARFTKYQSQLFQVMFLWLVLCFIQVLVTRQFSPHSIIIFIPSLAYFISHYLLLIRRKWIAETMLLIFFVGIIGINLLARYGRINSINYEGLMPKTTVYKSKVDHQGVMVLTEDLGIYSKNKLGGFFLNWNLSRRYFEQPDYYENVILVAEAFKTDPPDVIVDPGDLMKVFFDRIPNLESNYLREGNVYRKIQAKSKPAK
jgi:hypothetical protein